MASLGRSANVSNMEAKRAGRRLSGKTVPAATRAAQSVCVCIEHPLLGIKVCCQRLLSYYLLSASWAVPTSSQKLWVMLSPQQGGPPGTMTWAIHVTIAPTWFDPAETPGLITPFMFLYALHDALVKPMPAGPMTPSLAESWTVSKDGTSYEFLMRKGVKFHNGDAVTADDVKFSFE